MSELIPQINFDIDNYILITFNLSLQNKGLYVTLNQLSLILHNIQNNNNKIEVYYVFPSDEEFKQFKNINQIKLQIYNLDISRFILPDHEILQKINQNDINKMYNKYQHLFNYTIFITFDTNVTNPNIIQINKDIYPKICLLCQKYNINNNSLLKFFPKLVFSSDTEIDNIYKTNYILVQNLPNKIYNFSNIEINNLTMEIPIIVILKNISPQYDFINENMNKNIIEIDPNEIQILIKNINNMNLLFTLYLICPVIHMYDYKIYDKYFVFCNDATEIQLLIRNIENINYYKYVLLYSHQVYKFKNLWATNKQIMNINTYFTTINTLKYYFSDFPNNQKNIIIYINCHNKLNYQIQILDNNTTEIYIHQNIAELTQNTCKEIYSLIFKMICQLDTNKKHILFVGNNSNVIIFLISFIMEFNLQYTLKLTFNQVFSEILNKSKIELNYSEVSLLQLIYDNPNNQLLSLDNNDDIYNNDDSIQMQNNI